MGGASGIGGPVTGKGGALAAFLSDFASGEDCLREFLTRVRGAGVGGVDRVEVQRIWRDLSDVVSVERVHGRIIGLEGLELSLRN